jgi:hypothetical protein
LREVETRREAAWAVDRAVFDFAVDFARDFVDLVAVFADFVAVWL